MVYWYIFGLSFGVGSFIYGSMMNDTFLMVTGMICFALNFLALKEAQ